jgi:hypothetical protein
MGLRLPPFKEVMPFKVREKFLQVRVDDLSIRAELLAQLIRNLAFFATQFQQFEHARADEVQPKHPSVEDVENDGSILIVRRAQLWRYLHEKRLPS